MSAAARNAKLPCGHPAEAVVPGEESRRGVTMHCGICAATDHPATDQRMRALERSLAYEYAVSVIDGNCLALPDLGLDHYHLGSISGDDAGSMIVTLEAVSYLAWRGLIQRHGKNPDWIGILDEWEEKR